MKQYSFEKKKFLADYSSQEHGLHLLQLLLSEVVMYVSEVATKVINHFCLSYWKMSVFAHSTVFPVQAHLDVRTSHIQTGI